MNINYNLVRKLYRIFAVIVFVITVFFVGVLTISAFDIAKDGEFCRFANAGEPYDFEYGGIKCDFLFSGLKEPLFVFIVMQLISQIPLLGLYFLARIGVRQYLRFKDKNNK